MPHRTLESMSFAVESLLRGTRSGDASRRRTRVGVITDETAMGTQALAALERARAAGPDLRQQTEMRIRHCAAPAASVRDFVDLTPECSAPSLEAAVDAMADDPGCDAVLVAIGADNDLTAKTLVGAARRVSRDHPGTTVVIVCPAALQGPARSARARRSAPDPRPDPRAGHRSAQRPKGVPRGGRDAPPARPSGG